MTENGYPWRCLKRNSEFSANDSTSCRCVCECLQGKDLRWCSTKLCRIRLDWMCNSGALLETRVNIIKHEMHTKTYDMVWMSVEKRQSFTWSSLCLFGLHTLAVFPCYRKPTHADSFEIQQIPSNHTTVSNLREYVVCFSLNCTFGKFY